MQTLNASAGERFAMGVLDAAVTVSASDGRTGLPDEIVVGASDNGVTFTARVGADVRATKRVFVVPTHTAQLLQSTEAHAVIQQTTDYDTARYGELVQWMVVSLNLLQRVQRVSAWNALMNDVLSAIPDVAAGRPLIDAMWSTLPAREAALSLMAVGAGTRVALPYSGDDIRVDEAASADQVSRLSMSPADAIRQMGPHAAQLLADYLSMQTTEDAAPEVDVLQPSLDTRLVLSIEQEAPLSVVAVARRCRLDTLVWETVGIHEVFVLGPNTPTVPFGVPFTVPNSPPRIAFNQLLRQSDSMALTWNNYNIGYRGSAWYLLPGSDVRGAANWFTARGLAATRVTPLSRAVSVSTGGVMTATRDSALYASLADLGDDPILQALIGREASQSVPVDARAADSFSERVYWAPRRLEGAVFVGPALPTTQSVEVDSGVLGARVANGVNSMLREVAHNKFSDAPDPAHVRYARRGVLSGFDEKTAALLNLPVTRDRLPSLDKAFSAVSDYTAGARQTLVEISTQNAYLRAAANAARSQTGGVLVKKFVRVARELLLRTKSAGTPSYELAMHVCALVTARVLALELLRGRFPNLPAVDEQLTFEAVSERALRYFAGRTPTESDVRQVREFNSADPRTAFLLAAQRDAIEDTNNDGSLDIVDLVVAVERPPVQRPVVIAVPPKDDKPVKLSPWGALALAQYANLRTSVTAYTNTEAERAALTAFLVSTGLHNPLAKLQSATPQSTEAGFIYKNAYARLGDLPALRGVLPLPRAAVPDTRREQLRALLPAELHGLVDSAVLADLASADQLRALSTLPGGPALLGALLQLSQLDEASRRAIEAERARLEDERKRAADEEARRQAAEKAAADERARRENTAVLDLLRSLAPSLQPSADDIAQARGFVPLTTLPGMSAAKAALASMAVQRSDAAQRLRATARRIGMPASVMDGLIANTESSDWPLFEALQPIPPMAALRLGNALTLLSRSS